MVKTQVQIPDELFARAKELAAQKEWSFAEVVRRGLEYMTQTSLPQYKSRAEWCPPSPHDLGAPMAPEDQWTEVSH